MKSSSVKIHPADTEGKYPQRLPSAKFDEPFSAEYPINDVFLPQVPGNASVVGKQSAALSSPVVPQVLISLI